jgi:hypothetical protein
LAVDIVRTAPASDLLPRGSNFMVEGFLIRSR